MKILEQGFVEFSPIHRLQWDRGGFGQVSKTCIELPFNLVAVNGRDTVRFGQKGFNLLHRNCIEDRVGVKVGMILFKQEPYSVFDAFGLMPQFPYGRIIEAVAMPHKVGRNANKNVFFGERGEMFLRYGNGGRDD